MYQSLDSPADCSLFRHPTYSACRVGVPLRLLSRKRILLGKSCGPAGATLEPLIQEMGGTVVNRLKDADYIFVEDAGKRDKVVSSLLTHYSETEEDKERLYSLGDTKRVLRINVCSCILLSE
jgi:hypothetical protein